MLLIDTIIFPAYDSEMPNICVFLGNPGIQYHMTRHNLPWTLCDHYSGFSHSASLWRTKFHGLIQQIALADTQQLILLKPQTFVNMSGKSVQAAQSFFKVAPEHIFVVHDDLELPFGSYCIQMGGGFGGHNGLRSIGNSLGTPDFCRLRMGIGRPVKGSVSSFVLSRFTPDEEAVIPEFVHASGDLLLHTIKTGKTPAGPKKVTSIYT